MASTQGKQRTPPQESLVGQSLYNGEYHIQRVLGHGGMGKVYLATHTALTIPLALKQARADEPLPESVIAELDDILYDGKHKGGDVQGNDFPTSGGTSTDRFLREALLLVRLQHPAIPSLYDYFFEDGYWYLVMDYIPGPTLSAYLRQHAPLPPLEALNYAMQLCDVLDYLHGQSPPIVFRDLKPSNVILTPNGTLMLVDFGIARYFKTGQVNDTTDFGSPGYAPPEQYQGEGQTDGRSDLFSLGIMLYEMLSGQRPKGGIQDSLQHINPKISAVLSGLVTLATRSEPMYRFQSAHTFYLALERAYGVEEQQAYQQLSLNTQEAQSAGPAETSSAEPSMDVQAPATGGPARDAQGEAPILPPVALSSEQRRQVREALQAARRERLEEERLEIHLASVDESLKMRSSVPLSYTPLPQKEESEDSTTAIRSSLGVRHIVQTGFFLALILFVVMASLLVYVRFVQHPGSISRSGHIQATPAATATTRGVWQVLPSLPSAEADNTAIYVQTQGRTYIYMSGGYRGSTRSPYYDRGLYRYDIAAAHWEMLTDTHLPGMVNNAVAQDEHGHLFFTAGYSTDTYTITSLLYQYQPTTNLLQKIVPPAQVSIGFGSAMVADQQGHLYLTQGFLRSGNAHREAGVGWYRYDIATGQWHLLAPLAIGLGYLVLASSSAHDIILMGGARDAGQRLQTSQMYRYDTIHNTWTQAEIRTPSPISGAASCVTRPDQLIVVGGFDATHNTTSGQTWLVDLRTLHWTTLASLPSGGSMLGAAACDGAGHVFLVRGANDPNRPTPDFWELTIP